MSSSTQDVFDPITYKLTLILHLLSLPMHLGQVTLFFTTLPDTKAETAAFASLYSHGSHIPTAQARATHDRQRASAGISLCLRVLNWIILSVTEWGVGVCVCLAGILKELSIEHAHFERLLISI